MPEDDAATVGDSRETMTIQTGGGDSPILLPRPLRAVDVVLRTFQILGMGIVVLLMLLTVAHVIGRYIFDFPMLGVVEISGLMVVTLVFLAAPYDFFIDRHIAVDVIVRRLRPGARLAVQFAVYFVTLVVVSLALIWTIRQGNKVAGSGAETDMLRMPLYPFYFVVAFGWLLSIVAIISRLARYILEAKAVEE